MSVALMAAFACLPVVIAAGFLTDRSPDRPTAAAVPSDISVLALRGGLDAPFDRTSRPAARAGY